MYGSVDFIDPTGHREHIRHSMTSWGEIISELTRIELEDATCDGADVVHDGRAIPSTCTEVRRLLFFTFLLKCRDLFHVVGIKITYCLRNNVHVSSLNYWRGEWIAEHQGFQRDFEAVCSLFLIIFENIMSIQR